MKSRPGEKIKLASVDELLGIPNSETSADIDVDRIEEFKDHPFKVIENDEMRDLVESIQANGVLTPVLVRPIERGKYEMISGHRRLFAVKHLGLKMIPAIIRELDDEDATIAMVDMNLQREQILPSEKAFAYKMRYDAMRKKGGRPKKGKASQVGREFQTDVMLAKMVGESRNQLHRYLRLTELTPDLLKLVDLGKIPLMTGVELSHLETKVQMWIYEYIRENGVVKSYQVSDLRRHIEEEERITQRRMIEILNETQPGRHPSRKVTLQEKRLNDFFPAYYSAQEMENVIFELLKNWKKNGGEEHAI